MVVKMLQVYNDKKQRIALIDKAKDLCIESTLEYGDKKLTFKYPKKDSLVESLKNEYYIRTKKDEYVIKSIADGEKENEYIAQLNIEELESKQFVTGFESVEKTISVCLSEALQSTGWKIGECNISKRRTIRKDTQCNAWEVIKDCVSTYRVEIKINSLEKTIDIYEQVGNDKGSYIIEGLNLKKITRKKTTYDFFNVVIPLGKDNIGIDVLGKNYIENFQYTDKRIVRIWKDERYTNTTSLYDDAKAKLEEASKPIEAYSAEVADLAAQNEKYSILEYEIGDVVELISKSNGIKTKQRIVKLKQYPYKQSQNNVELSTAKKTFAEIQKQAQEVSKQEAIEVSNNATNIKLDSYYTKEESESKIAANADSILLEVSKTYQTGNQVEDKISNSLKDYLTEEETKAAIKLESESIIIEASKTYQTKTQVTDLIDGVIKDYSTTEVMRSEIKTAYDEINLEVSKKVNDDEIISKINLTEEEIKILANKIKFEGLVTANDSFIIHEDGTIEAVNARFSGTINSSKINGGSVVGALFQSVKSDYISLEIKNESIKFYDWKTSHEYIGSIESVINTGTDEPAITITHPPDSEFIISYKNDPDPYSINSAYMRFDKHGHSDPIITYRGLKFNNNTTARFTNGSAIYDSTTPYFTIRGANDILFLSNNNSLGQMVIHQSSFDSWGQWKHNGNFIVTGSKNRVVETENYGAVLMNAVESSSCLFEDNGTGFINNDEICIVYLDIIFAETVNADCEYYIQLTKYGTGELYVKSKTREYFVVAGSVGMKFDWNVKAKQKGYENERMIASSKYQSPVGIELINDDVLQKQKILEKEKFTVLENCYENYIDKLLERED